jgi:choline dehydrogenase-like flavoprotein
MELFDVIIVGSGPSAVSALESLKNKKVLVIDAGIVSDFNLTSFDESISILKKNGKINFSDVIGDQFESLNNINHEYMSPKIKAPMMRFISDKYNEFNKFKTKNFFVLGSFAKGGLSNAWGAGSMRYTDEELKEFPIKYSDLETYYNFLTNRIGISGKDDDLKQEFMDDGNLLPPPKLNFLASELLRKYIKKKKYFKKINLKIGFPRSAIITAPKKNRKVYDYKGLEFFKPYDESIYNSKFFLEDLVRENNNIKYIDKKLVTSFSEEQENIVCVNATDILSHGEHAFYAKKLILAAGCLSTSKIVLTSFKDYDFKLPILDNLVTYIPFVNFKYIGKKEDDEFIPPQLLLITNDTKNKYLCSMYKLNATLCGDYLMDFPLTLKGTLRAVKYLAPAILIMQVFYPDHQKAKNYLKLNTDSSVEISYQDEEPRGPIEKTIIAAFRKLGFFSLSLLVKKLIPGNSFHYSGTLPMSTKPSKFQTDASCKLYGTQNVFIVDGSVFPILPAKNNTFTIMANAMRVGDIVSKSL